MRMRMLMVLGGYSRMLLRPSRVLGGCSRVLGGYFSVLGVIVMVLGGSFRVLVNVELDCRHAGPQDAVGVDVRVAESEAAERALQLVERKAGVDERAERHVARDAGEAVEIQHAAHSRPDS